MKSAEEWDNRIDDMLQMSTYQLKKLQMRVLLLDAFKAGMTEAAEMVKAQDCCSDFCLDHDNGGRLMFDKIIKARDKKEKI